MAPQSTFSISFISSRIASSSIEEKLKGNVN